MQPPNPKPQRLGLLTSLVAVYIYVQLLASVSIIAAASAAEVPIAANGHILVEPVSQSLAGTIEDYAPDFAYLDRSLIGRQAPDIEMLTNNEAIKKEIAAGTTLHFVLERSQLRLRQLVEAPRDALELRDVVNKSAEREGTATEDQNTHYIAKRQAGTHVWLSANTCRQPVPDEEAQKSPNEHPQLVMYVSISPENQRPGPEASDNLANNITTGLFDSGYGLFDVNTTSDVYVGISAPVLPEGWTGSWQFELAASTDRPYHNYNNANPFLFMVDTDSDSTLFITAPLDTSNSTDVVEKWTEQNPFRMFAFQADDFTAITGMEHSFCAIQEQFNSNTTKNFTVTTSITTKFDQLPKAQFHVQNLDTAKTYNGFVVVEGNNVTSALPDVGTVAGGGLTFLQFNWTTKADDSCQVLFDLAFCDSVAYAVPSSSKFKNNDTELGKLYDDEAKKYFTNFNNSLAQIACETVSEAQYSLARTCDDCRTDYKNWLCSVMIPRCEDWTDNAPWLQPRRINEPLADGSVTYNGNVSAEFNATHRDRFAFKQSRNPMIDEIIQPGPYKELLPCEDLCFDIVRSCPAKLGFACPISPARELSYGKKDPTGNALHCSFPGAVIKLNLPSGAVHASVSMKFVAAVSFIIAALLVLQY